MSWDILVQTFQPTPRTMKLLGIIGGIGPESTIDYYRLFIAAYQQQQPDAAIRRFSSIAST
jgi:aspartate/glutamate racemase